LQLPVLKIGNLVPKYPIIQGGMSIKVSTSSLAAAVARAGGIGVIGGTGITLEELKNEIQTARTTAGGGILGVNIMFAAHQFKDMVQTAINECIDVIFTGAGFSRDIFEMGKKGGVPIVPIVSSARAARLAERCGAAAVVAEGTEAGGHLGTDRSIKEILPEIKEAVKIPVVAAGGIVNGFDMAEMIKLGADGIQMATRFVLSEECSVADAYKQVYLNATEDDIVIVKSPVGMPGRAIRNKFSELMEKTAEPPKTKCNHCLKQCSHVYCITQALLQARNGNVDKGLVFAGKNVFKIKDILPVEKIFQNILSEYATS
jgi:NAD(P)H-dependent flavin oxidoreductase YrpB (nitropropane dioxygenase family)